MESDHEESMLTTVLNFIARKRDLRRCCSAFDRVGRSAVVFKEPQREL
jgi:hypothetical protein